MRIAEGTFDLGMQIFEELASAGLRRGCAGTQSGIEDLFGFGTESWVVVRESI
jgi:hypothetical protein